LLALLIFLLLASGVKGTTNIQEAKNALANAKGQIRAATTELYYHWENITEGTHLEVLDDIAKAWDWCGISQTDFENGQYNASLEEAYWAWFLAYRAEYRIYLEIAEICIETANSTINNIPFYIAAPTQAIEKLDQAIKLFNQSYLDEVFGNLRPLKEVKIFINAIGRVEAQLYWNEDSVVKLANEACCKALNWRGSQEKIYNQSISNEINSVSLSFYAQILIPFSIDLIFAMVFLGPMIGKLRRWTKKKTSRKIRWDGDLWRSRGLIITTLGAITALIFFSWIWLDSVYGLHRNYGTTIAFDLIHLIERILWVLFGLTTTSWALLIVNKFTLRKYTGLFFTTILIIQLFFSVTIVILSWSSLRHITHVTFQ